MTPVDLISTCEIVKVTLPLLGRRRLDLDGFPVSSEPPYFELSFGSKSLPVDDLNLGAQCEVSFDVGGVIYVVKAQIDKVISPRQLRLAPVKSYSNIQKREYFRIDTEVGLAHRPVGEENWSPLARHRVNLSGGGIRFPVERRFRLRDRIEVWIYFGDFTRPDVRAVGQVVRMDEHADGSLDVAINFAEITLVDRDKVISFCFSQQREHLRKRVQIKPER